MKYGSTIAKDGERVVHNFPAEGRRHDEDGFRYWTENVADAEADETAVPRVRCYCDWTAKVPERRRALRKGVSSGFYSGPTGSGLTGDQDPGGL